MFNTKGKIGISTISILPFFCDSCKCYFLFSAYTLIDKSYATISPLCCICSFPLVNKRIYFAILVFLSRSIEDRRVIASVGKEDSCYDLTIYCLLSYNYRGNTPKCFKLIGNMKQQQQQQLDTNRERNNQFMQKTARQYIFLHLENFYLV